MPKRMLIDASHPEETRVVVLDGQKVEEFDFEAASKRPLKGNIYLAKVTRVEPSLQAAFVEYGGNRQGFLAFSEIHPDYYQIPVADRIALLAEQEADARRRQEDDFESFDIRSGRKADAPAQEPETNGDGPDEAQAPAEGENGFSEPNGWDESRDSGAPSEDGGPAQDEQAAPDEFPEGDEPEERNADESEATEPAGFQEIAAETDSSNGEKLEHEETRPEADTQGADSEAAQPLESARPTQRWMRKRHYKIQEVIKRRQVILVQVVKEERGNKGAALTTYLSLAGRYCVLMPNTPRGGGISRKITNAADRKRLKSAAQALELPEGMGLIIRTAGENRTKVEIKRDYEYLLRLWDTIRELTLKSNAPACVHEEGDLIKRAIRDLYNKDVSEVIVEGDEGYRNAKDFMRMLMPSHAKNVKPFKEPLPLFQRYHIEAQLDAMFSPTVTLKSGGYIVINQTEALVSIDVNSGRATREHSIEETATKTNLEAADEIGRQLRLRDLAGLIVIDFIDMEDSRNDRAVEKRMHNAVKNDRARVQLGKISQFGLLEMSRQRLRAGVIAGSTVPCPHCGGQGIVRSVESTSLRVLRGLEEEAQKQRADGLIVRVATEVAIYTLNQKRRELTRLENEYDMTISFDPKEDLKAGDFDIERIGQRDPETRPKPPPPVEDAPPVMEEEIEPEIVEDSEPVPAEDTIHEEIPAESHHHLQQGEEGSGRRRRRRRRRGGRDRDRPVQGEQRPEAGQPVPQIAEDSGVQETYNGDAAGELVEADTPLLQAPPNGEGQQTLQQGPFGEGPRRKRRRRRGRRGGRDRENSGGRTDNGAPSAVEGTMENRFGQPDEIDTTPRDEPKRPVEIQPARGPEAIPNAASTPVWSLKGERPEIPPQQEQEKVSAEAEAPRETSASPQPAKKGWWQRAFRSD